MDTKQTPVFSFVLPAYNEEMNIKPMAERLCAVAETLGEPYEVIWVDDGSTDGTGDVLDVVAAENPQIRVLHFSRNFGHMAALTAGLEHASGSGAVVCLDSDGQHPPEIIPQMVARWRDGVDIVQSVRLESVRQSWLKRVTSRGFYQVLNMLADVRLPAGAADFRLLDRQVLDALNALPERVRFMRGLVYWLGFRLETLPYECSERLGGKTKYSFLKMAQFALSGITSFSYRPLRLAFLLGVIVTGMAILDAAYILWCYAKGIPLVPGWASTVLAILALGGVQLMTLGIASEYMARLYFEQKQRPIYILRRSRRRNP